MNQKGFVMTSLVTLVGASMLVASTGVLPQRLGWRTLTDVDYSFAISFPPSWVSVGGSSLVSLGNGRSSVSIQSQTITPGTTTEEWATENGAPNGFLTSLVNAYDALESVSGNAAIYYIVNGGVGYKITTLNGGDSDTLRTMLLTFTVTKQR